MAGGINKVILIGNLGTDPELRYTPNGQPVCNFSVATSDSWMDKQGQKQERTEWHRIVVWGKMGELCKEYLAKGRQAYIEGRIQTRQWNDREGQKRYTTEIIAQQVQFLGARGNNTFSGSSEAPTQARRPNDTPESQAATGGDYDFGPPPMDDDVPF